MNKYLLIFLVSPVSFFAMEQQSEQKKQIIARIVKKEMVFEEAEALINTHCHGDLALKAYACVYLNKMEKPRSFWEWSKERKDYLAMVKEQSHDNEFVNDVVEVMLQAVDDYVERRERFGPSYDPYAFAYKLKKENGMLFLKSLGLKPTRNTISSAVYASDCRFTKLLVEAGAEYTDPKDPDHNMQHHPLYVAAMVGNEQMVALLIKEGGIDLSQKYKGRESEQRTIIGEVQRQLEYWTAADQSFDGHRKSKLQAEKALEILKEYSLGHP